jgi:hypothetical protein
MTKPVRNQKRVCGRLRSMRTEVRQHQRARHVPTENREREYMNNILPWQQVMIPWIRKGGKF